MLSRLFHFWKLAVGFVINNEKKLSKENGSEELWDLIEFYDRLLCEQYNMISVF